MQPKQRSEPSDAIADEAQSNRSVATRTRNVQPLLPLAALTGCTCWFAGKLALALLRRHRRLGQQSPSGVTPAAAGAPAAHLPELASLDPTDPAGFFLPDPALSTLADCFAVVQGVRLPLHSQVLSTQATVLRELFVGQRDAAGAGEALVDLTPLFAPAAPPDSAEAGSLEAAACFLRLVYCPQEVHPASFAVLGAAGWLAWTARLAHRLDAARLLQGLEAHIRGLCSRLSAEQASLSQLLAALGAAQACCMDGAAAACLEAVADKLAASGGRWPTGQASELAAFDPATLARLLQLLSVRAVGSTYRSPAVFDVRPDCGADLEGGFTWCIQGFSRLGGVQEPGLLSPWVEVGGFQWRLQVYPSGKRDGAGSHLSIFLCIDPAHMKAARPRVRSVTTCFRATVLDQGPAGQDFTKEGRVGGDSFSQDNQNWGYFRGVPLAELRRRDRGFLAGDRLLLRLDMRITRMETL